MNDSWPISTCNRRIHTFDRPAVLAATGAFIIGGTQEWLHIGRTEMAVLSDRSIKKLMQSNELVIGGEQERARQCSYRFRPHMIFHSNENRTKDISAAQDDPHDFVEPGEYVWIRMREFVKLPKDICAFWWQTNSLSRQGLLLMNMSIVEAGYEGPLSCLFVNFSRTTVAISPETTMAKLVFAKLDEAAQIPSTRNNLDISDPREIIRYDEKLHREALNRPASFLQVDDKFKELQDRIVADIEDKAQEITNSNIDKVKEDIPGAIRESTRWAAGAIAVLVLVSTVTPWVQQFFSPKLNLESEVSQLVERELFRLIGLELQRQNSAVEEITPDISSQDDLSQRYETLQEKYDLLEQRINTLEQTP
ncbi:MAG: hypothetical protein F6K42_03440 [Leptolyngbya sp. SIO1D8]|nr:hypothetical protein [Leptolyngbya sp. SIO1D8]